jgi:hypothetical protein
MNFDDPNKLIHAIAKLRGSTDGAAVLWWYRGCQYGVIDQVKTLLWQVEGAQLGKFVEAEGGALEHVFRDVMFYLDAETSELLTTYTNPFTGETNEPPVMRMGPFRIRHSVTGADVVLPEGMPPGAMEVEWHYEPAVVQGGEVLIRETGSTRIANHMKDSGKPGISTKDHFMINDFFTLSGMVADIENDSLPSAPARTSYQSINEWTPWLGMGDRPGFVFGSGTSRKLKSTDELPGRLAALIDQHEPGFFSDPDFPLWDASYHPLNQEQS